MKLGTMSSIQHWAQPGRPRAVDLGIDPCKDIPFSWSGINLVVDLEIDERGQENGENGENGMVADRVADHASPKRSTDALEAAADAPGGPQESSSLHRSKGAVEGILVNPKDDEKEECSELQPSDGEGKCGSGVETQGNNWTQCAWPDWGEPLTPDDDLEDDMDSVAEVENPLLAKKMVNFSDTMRLVVPGSLQEERETGSFSYLGSSDDELEQGTEQVTCSTSDGHRRDLSRTPISSSSEREGLDSEDVSAACHILGLGNECNYGHSELNGFGSPGVSGRDEGDFVNLRRDLDRLSELVEKIYAALPQLSSLSGSQGSGSSPEVRYWTIVESENIGRFRMKRIKREVLSECNGLLGLHDADGDENEVLERPPWKQHFRALSKIS